MTSGCYWTQTFKFIDFKMWLITILEQPHPKDLARSFQNLIGKDCPEIFIEIPKILEL